MPTLYGIPNCDKVRAARKWLQENGIEYVFVDFKRTPPTPELLTRWLRAHDSCNLLNTRGTTWRRTPADVKKAIIDEPGTLEYLVTNPSAIKRPILDTGTATLVGFDPEAYQALFAE